MVPRTIFLAVISTTYQVTFASSITITRAVTVTFTLITGVIRSAAPSPTIVTSGTSLTSWRRYRLLTTIILLIVPRTVFLAVISTTYQVTFASAITITSRITITLALITGVIRSAACNPKIVK